MSISRRDVTKKLINAVTNPKGHPNKMTSELAKWVQNGGKIR